MSKRRTFKPSVSAPTLPNVHPKNPSFPYPSIVDPYENGIPTPTSAASSRAITSSGSIFLTSTNTLGAAALKDEDAIRVVVRIRPMNSLEKQRSDGQCTYAADDGQTITIQKIIDGKPVKPLTFHKCFPEYTSQDTMFEDSGIKDLIEKALEGYVATVFAYGQTGSGKSFTISGPEDVSFNDSDLSKWGLVPRSLKHLFSTITEKSIDGTNYTVKASYLEIYNEQVQDLLNPSNTSLSVRWTREKSFYVENLFVVECEVFDDILAVLEEGLRNRKVGSHRLNQHSSRSHGLMTITIECETIDPDDQRIIKRTGKISFVDLAGSEKVKESKAQGETLVETLNINKSLLTLGNCISALADMKKRKSGTIHVPYRDSKLTKLLSDSLGGSGYALMIACVSPSAVNVNETINTLRYASRAKKIQNRPVIMMDPREELIAKLKNELNLVRSENENLKLLISGNPATLSGTEGKDVDKLKREIDEYKNRELKWQIEKQELLQENDQVSSKMEKLRQAFGANLEALESDNNGMSAPFKAPSSARLLLMGSKDKLLEAATKRSIDRSMADVSILKAIETTETPNSHLARRDSKRENKPIIKKYGLNIKAQTKEPGL